MKTIAVIFALLAVSSASLEDPQDVGELLRSLFEVTDAAGVSDAVLGLLADGEVNACIIYNWAADPAGRFINDFLVPIRDSASYINFLVQLSINGVNVEEGTAALEDLLNLNPEKCAGITGDTVDLEAIGEELGDLYPTLDELYNWHLMVENSPGAIKMKEILNMDDAKQVATDVSCNDVIQEIVGVFEGQGYPDPGFIIAYLIELLNLDWDYPPECTVVHSANSRSLVELLNSIRMVLNIDELVEVMKTEINAENPQVDLCRVFLWYSGQADGNTEFLDMLARLQAQENFRAIVEALQAEGVDTAGIEQAFIDLITAPTTCVYDGQSADLNSIGEIFRPHYPTEDSLLEWLGANLGNEDFLGLIEAVSGPSDTWAVVNHLSCDPTVQLIIAEFVSQDYEDPGLIIDGIGGLLGWPELDC